MCENNVENTSGHWIFMASLWSTAKAQRALSLGHDFRAVPGHSAEIVEEPICFIASSALIRSQQ
jgi:hypothetical protein